MANINILDANDEVVATPVPPAFGPQTAANSRSVTLATDQTPVPVIPTTDREVTPVSYRVDIATSGANVGDLLTATRTLDISGPTPTTISTTWFNHSTGAELSAAPSPATISPIDSSLLGEAITTSLNSSNILNRLPAPTISGLFPVDTLATPRRMTPQTVTSASQSIALATTTRRVSVDATTATIVRINAAASLPANGTALTDAIAIPAGVTKDFDVPASTTLHFIRDGAIDGTIRVTELL